MAELTVAQLRAKRRAHALTVSLSHGHECECDLCDKANSIIERFIEEPTPPDVTPPPGARLPVQIEACFTRPGELVLRSTGPGAEHALNAAKRVALSFVK